MKKGLTKLLFYCIIIIERERKIKEREVNKMTRKMVEERMKFVEERLFYIAMVDMPTARDKELEREFEHELKGLKEQMKAFG